MDSIDEIKKQVLNNLRLYKGETSVGRSKSVHGCLVLTKNLRNVYI